MSFEALSLSGMEFHCLGAAKANALSPDDSSLACWVARQCLKDDLSVC